jgi:hypothetical protein
MEGHSVTDPQPLLLWQEIISDGEPVRLYQLGPFPKCIRVASELMRGPSSIMTFEEGGRRLVVRVHNGLAVYRGATYDYGMLWIGDLVYQDYQGVPDHIERQRLPGQGIGT